MTGRINWSGIFFCLMLAGVWEWTAQRLFVSSRLFPPLSVVLLQFEALTISGVLPTALGETLWRMGLGLGAASVVMIPLGVGVGVSPQAWLALRPSIESIRSVPPVLMILPAMLVLGIGDSLKVFVVFFAAAFPILLNTMDGVRAIPVPFLDTARTFRTSPLVQLTEVIMPAAAPGIFAGLKTAVPIAFIVAIVSEMVGGTDGIGLFLMRSQRAFDIPQMYAAIVATAVTGGMLAYAMIFIEAKCLVWYAGWKRVSFR